MMNNPMEMLQMLRSNPMQFLLKMKLNVPESVIGDPNAILNHLLSTGQISQQQVNQAYRMAQRFR